MSDSENKISTGAEVGAGLVASARIRSGIAVENFWHLVNWRRPAGCDCPGCLLYRSAGANLRNLTKAYCRNAFIAWEEHVPNIVVTAGKNDILTQYFKGSAYTAAWYAGLVDGAVAPTYAAADTMASHAGWTENTGYSNAARIALVLGTASAGSIDNSANIAAFSINATGTIAGAFTVTVSTKGGTTGTLYGEASFSAGNRSVLSGDTLNVTVTLTAS